MTPSLFAEPRRIIDADEASELLTAVMPDLDGTDLRERLASKRGFVWLKREISAKQQNEVHDLGVPGVGFLTENKRVYPNGCRSLACDRPRQRRQPGHRRHREMARRPRARRPASRRLCLRPQAGADRTRARSARAARGARRTHRGARQVQGSGRRGHRHRCAHRRNRVDGVGPRLRPQQSARGARSDPHQPAHHRRL